MNTPGNPRSLSELSSEVGSSMDVLKYLARLKEGGEETLLGMSLPPDNHQVPWWWPEDQGQF